MARLLSFLVFIYSCALVAHGQNLANLMTIQSGNTGGSCDSRTALLNQYAIESLQSVTVAIQAITDHAEKNTANGTKVRRALNQFFKIAETVTPAAKSERNKIKKNLGFIQSWFSETLGGIPKSETFLFCDSSFLVRKAVTDTAKDYTGQDIKQNGQNVPISTAYPSYLKGGNIPWWAGDQTTANGYYFTQPNSGGDYCNTAGNDGITANLNLFVADPNGGPPTQHAEYSTVVLCPNSFTRADRPDTWLAGSRGIRAGASLQTALPKCTTLLHEAFHLIFGAGSKEPGMLEGRTEFYTLAECVDRSKAKVTLRRNPENYVFFISSMYYLFGTAPAIPVNWDFTNRVEAARSP